MLSRRERKRQKKIQKLANEGEAPEKDSSRAGDSYRRRNRHEDIMKGLPLVLLNVLSFFILYGVLSSSVGRAVSLGISIPTVLFMNFIMYGIVSKTYTPSYEKFIVLGHIDPENTDSAWLFQKWLIPRKIISKYFIMGRQFSLMTSEGLMFFAEYLDFDYDTGDLKITFGWPTMDEFAFLTEHGVFHNMKDLIPLLLKKIQQLEANIEVLVHLEAKDLEAAHFKRIMHVMLDMTRAKTNEDLGRLQQEMDKTNEQINIRLKPKNKVPDVDLTAGGGSE
jgi:hypothetical protein